MATKPSPHVTSMTACLPTRSATANVMPRTTTTASAVSSSVRPKAPPSKPVASTAGANVVQADDTVVTRPARRGIPLRPSAVGLTARIWSTPIRPSSKPARRRRGRGARPARPPRRPWRRPGPSWPRTCRTRRRRSARSARASRATSRTSRPACSMRSTVSPTGRMCMSGAMKASMNGAAAGAVSCATSAGSAPGRSACSRRWIWSGERRVVALRRRARPSRSRRSRRTGRPATLAVVLQPDLDPVLRARARAIRCVDERLLLARDRHADDVRAVTARRRGARASPSRSRCRGGGLPGSRPSLRQTRSSLSRCASSTV